MSIAMGVLFLLLLVPAGAGVLAYRLTRQVGTGAAWRAWAIVLVVAFVLIRLWYVRASNCAGPETVYVPFIGAFAAASGAWVGITRGKEEERHYWLVRIAIESALYSMVPGAFFILLQWGC